LPLGGRLEGPPHLVQSRLVWVCDHGLNVSEPTRRATTTTVSSSVCLTVPIRATRVGRVSPEILKWQNLFWMTPRDKGAGFFSFFFLSVSLFFYFFLFYFLVSFSIFFISCFFFIYISFLILFFLFQFFLSFFLFFFLFILFLLFFLFLFLFIYLFIYLFYF
jgi:hypothetical protein